MEKNNTVYVKRISIMLLISLLLLLIYLASDILFPVVLAFLLAVLIRPIDNFLNTRLKIPRLLAIFMALLLVSGIFIAIILFMVLQVTEFMSDIPHIKQAFGMHVNAVNEWSVHTLGMKLIYPEQLKISSLKVKSISYVSSASSSLMYFVLVPIYVFFILMYRSLLLTFLLKIVPQQGIENLQKIVNTIKSIIRNYILGLLLEVLVVAILTSAGLYIVGVKYFIFLGVLTAFLNLIPYIGIIIAFFVSSFLALVNAQHFEIILWILIVNAIVQFIDNNILIPKIVGSKVSINALASMMSVIIGGALAGLPGMFLAIPIIAILKVVFDHVPQLQAYGYLLGDDIPKSFNWQKIRMSKGKKPE